MKHFAFILLSFFLLSGCAGVQVHTDYEKNTDFSRYSSFAFLRSSIDESDLNDIDKRRIMRAISENLESKGMRKSSQPDILVSFFVQQTNRVDVWQDMWGWGWGMWGPNVSTYTEGTLFIDIIDRRKNMLIWQGQGNGIFVRNPKKREANINKFVDEIIRRLPIK